MVVQALFCRYLTPPTSCLCTAFTRSGRVALLLRVPSERVVSVSRHAARRPQSDSHGGVDRTACVPSGAGAPVTPEKLPFPNVLRPWLAITRTTLDRPFRFLLVRPRGAVLAALAGPAGM
jgi:hypothetical protein